VLEAAALGFQAAPLCVQAATPRVQAATPRAQAATSLPCTQAVCSLWRKTAAAGLSAAVYTQLSDVETELNGLMTYDRHLKCEALLRQRLPAEIEAARRRSVAVGPTLKRGPS